MADDQAALGRMYEQGAEGERKPAATPSIACRRMDVPKLDQKHGAMRPPRTAKVLMPFLDEMTDEAVAEMRRRLDEEDDDDDTAAMAPRTA